MPNRKFVETTAIGAPVISHSAKCSASPKLTFLAAESAHRVTGVASFILLANVGDQRLRMLHLHFQGGDPRVFGVNDNVTRLLLKLNPTANCTCVLSRFSENSTIQFGGEVCLSLCGRVADLSVSRALPPRKNGRSGMRSTGARIGGQGYPAPPG